MNFNKPLKSIVKIFLFSVVFVSLIISIIGSYFFGMVEGYKLAIDDTNGQIDMLMTSFLNDQKVSSEDIKPTFTPTPTKRIIITSTPQKITWGGPELWEEVNKKRVEYGVNPLKKRDDLCTISSIRLNELLELGSLDNHEGFSNLTERRPDLQAIFDNYSVVAEFLAFGGKTAQETVSLWENTLGHKKLLDGGEYVWGCIYAQNSFSVAIVSY